jgi:hypothetical protein
MLTAAPALLQVRNSEAVFPEADARQDDAAFVHAADPTTIEGGALEFATDWFASLDAKGYPRSCRKPV